MNLNVDAIIIFACLMGLVMLAVTYYGTHIRKRK